MQLARPLLLLMVAALAAGAAPASPPARGEPDAFRHARGKVALLRVEREGGRTWGAAFLAESGTLLTAYHVVRDARRVEAWLNGAPYAARVTAEAEHLDLAVVTLTRRDLLIKPLPLADSREMEPGDDLVAVTLPAARAGGRGDPEARRALTGSLQLRSERAGPTGAVMPQLVLLARAERGDSGAPVLRLPDGAVVGMLISRELPEADGVSRRALALPAELALPYLEPPSGAGRSGARLPRTQAGKPALLLAPRTQAGKPALLLALPRTQAGKPALLLAGGMKDEPFRRTNSQTNRRRGAFSPALSFPAPPTYRPPSPTDARPREFGWRHHAVVTENQDVSA